MPRSHADTRWPDWLVGLPLWELNQWKASQCLSYEETLALSQARRRLTNRVAARRKRERERAEMLGALPDLWVTMGPALLQKMLDGAIV